MPEIKCIIEGCDKPKHNQGNTLCKYCLEHANDRKKRYAKKYSANNKAKRKQWEEDFKKKNGVSASVYYYNQYKSGNSASRQTTKKISELCRIIDDMEDKMIELKIELDGYKSIGR